MNLKNYLKEHDTQTGLALKLNITQGAIYQWMLRSVPANRVLELERISGGLMSRHELRPDIYPIEDK